MTQATAYDLYRGVKCLSCKQPIPIPVAVAIVEEELLRDRAGSVEGLKCQIFHLRCRACGKEKPYKISEICEFERTALADESRAEPRSERSRYLGESSKAASA
jgi:hypothetical protein